jgi:hypothetical protein
MMVAASSAKFNNINMQGENAGLARILEKLNTDGSAGMCVSPVV